MLTDEEINYLNREILKLYQDMETDLIVDIARRFDTYDTIGGTLKWHLKKIDELGDLNQETVKIIASYSSKSLSLIKKMLKEASIANFDKKVLERVGINLKSMKESPSMAATFKNSYTELTQGLKMIQTSAQESTRQAYMVILNTAYLETTSGIYSYSESIRRAMQKMADTGITGATYKRKNVITGKEKIVRYSIEAAVRRDTLTSIHQTANRATIAMAKDNSVNTVEVSSHMGARVSATNPIANHAEWQGKCYTIEGETDKYPNLAKTTGYGDILGLAGVNCRHRMFLFWPGVSTPGQAQIDLKENAKRRALLDRQRLMERTVRQYKKRRDVAEASNDLDSYQKNNVKVMEKENMLSAFCKENKLSRDYEREQIA